MIENIKGKKDEKTKDICITCKQQRSIGEKKSNIEEKECLLEKRECVNDVEGNNVIDVWGKREQRWTQVVN